MSRRRRFLVVGQRAHTVPDFNSKDLCGGAGRWDVLARCINSAFFLSHDLRRDTELFILAQGPTDPPKLIRFDGGSLKHLNPDEWTTGALIRKALDVPLRSSWAPSTEGIFVIRSDLEGIATELAGDGPLIYLHEDGAPAHEHPLGTDGPVTFVLGDDRGMGEDEEVVLDRLGVIRLSLGPKALHSDHCITVVHNILDRREE